VSIRGCHHLTLKSPHRKILEAVVYKLYSLEVAKTAGGAVAVLRCPQDKGLPQLRARKRRMRSKGLAAAR